MLRSTQYIVHTTLRSLGLGTHTQILMGILVSKIALCESLQPTNTEHTCRIHRPGCLQAYQNRNQSVPSHVNCPNLVEHALYQEPKNFLFSNENQSGVVPPPITSQMTASTHSNATKWCDGERWECLMTRSSPGLNPAVDSMLDSLSRGHGSSVSFIEGLHTPLEFLEVVPKFAGPDTVDGHGGSGLKRITREVKGQGYVLGGGGGLSTATVRGVFIGHRLLLGLRGHGRKLVAGVGRSGTHLLCSVC